MPLFDSEGVLKMGKQKLMFYEKRIGDGNNVLSLNKTPGKRFHQYMNL